MEDLRYVSQEYQQQLETLAYHLMERFAQPIGQLVLFDQVDFQEVQRPVEAV